MKRRNPASHRSQPLVQVHRLTEGSELVSCDADTVLLVVRGGCTIRGATREPERLEAGALLLRQVPRQSDRRIARALSLLQADPAKRWTVERLARSVGLSRAAFARRFLDVSGRTPQKFLTDLRLALAATLLASSDESLAELAARVGYASEFAFSRAFKRRHGVAPGTFRRLRQSPSLSPIRMAA